MLRGMNEFDLIAELFAPLAAGYPGALGLKDDVAFLDQRPGLDIVTTVDAMVAGVHFLAKDPAGQIAAKLIRVNLSDLAAKGAAPFAVLLAAAFPRGVSEAWLRAFAQGLAADLKAFNIALIGGDTVATDGPLTLSVTAFGHVERGRALLRSGARAGDTLWVSGTIGDGTLGLRVALGELTDLDSGQRAMLLDRYRLPRPRIDLGARLVGLADAGMDISDGLVQDLGHLCRASGVGATIEAERVPLSEAARAVLRSGQTTLASLLTGGDDSELLFTAPPEAEGAIRALGGVSPIGRVEVGAGVRVRAGGGAVIPIVSGGWSHF